MKKKIILALIINAMTMLAAIPLFADKMAVLVTPFKNDGDAAFSWVSAGMTDTVAADLNRISGIVVVSEDDRRSALREMELGQTGLISEETAVKAGELTGANVIFTGSYTVYGDQIRVIAKLIRVDTGQVDKSIKIDGRVKDLFRVQDEVVIRLMKETEKIEINDIDPVKVRDDDLYLAIKGDGASYEAYELYSRGLEAEYADPDAAIAYYSRASELDPLYFAPANRAGIACVYYGRYEAAEPYFVKARTCLEKRGRVRTIEYAVLLNSMGGAFLARKNYEAAEKHFLQAGTAMEKIGRRDSYSYAAVQNNIARARLAKGDTAGAEKFYSRARQTMEKLGARKTYTYRRAGYGIGKVYDAKGDREKARQHYDGARRPVKQGPAVRRDARGKPDAVRPDERRTREKNAEGVQRDKSERQNEKVREKQDKPAGQPKSRAGRRRR
ncbi:MAG: tetratricopeptide repeat protein [Spirochaetes bacterium]|jgi:TolB-like protein|nr:tetratricopeptide repeat protein [Spirochaetota bacterium]